MNITRPIVMEIDLKNFHHNINNIRKNSKALQKGTTTFTNIDDDNKTFEIVRTYKKETKTIFVDAKNFVITIK